MKQHTEPSQQIVDSVALDEPPAPAAGQSHPLDDLPADLNDLVAEVITQVPRLLMLQDRDPDSPMRGCMHPGYWRDKTSDVADMRRQEAVLTFAWLWKYPFPANRYHQDAQLLFAAIRGLGFWYRMQNKDGTFDEWYKGEHGYAATAFSSYAVALTLDALGDKVDAPLRTNVVAALRRSGDWLASHHDWFKTNHEAVGVAALGAIGHVLNEDKYLQAASANAQMIGQRMHEEGWSSEISGLDVGYTFLLAEYTGMHAVLNGDTALLKSIAKAYRFASYFFHPDLSTGAEYGICGNPYFSRVATAILAEHEPIAAQVMQWMRRPSPGPRNTVSTLKDDLRLSRYAYQPLLAALVHSRTIERRDLPPEPPASPSQPEPLLILSPQQEQWFPAAKLLAIAKPTYCAWAAACHGGLVRVAMRQGDQDDFLPMVTDRGYAVVHKNKTYRNAHYRLDAATVRGQGQLQIEASISPCGFVQPPYWARVGLRVATSLPYGPRWSRWLIDQWRARKGTALNQSAAGVSSGSSQWTLHRQIEFLDDRLRVRDRIVSQVGPLDPNALWMVFDGPVRLANGLTPNVDRRIPVAGLIGNAAVGSEITIEKEIRCEDGTTVVHAQVK